MENDAWFFVGIFAFIFLIWVATGGPTRPLSFSGPTLEQPQELGGGNYLSLPRSPFGIGNNETNLSGSSERGGSYSSSNFFTNMLRGFPFGTPSPYQGLVRLNTSVSNASSTDAQRESLRLEVPRRSATPVTISGWRFVSEITGKAAVIPTGTKTPTLGIVNAREPITLTAGERAIISTGRSPIGTSFRENICTGYLDGAQAFTPRLPRQCPAPMAEFQRVAGPYYLRDTSCVEYVKTLGKCETVTYVSSKVSTSCRAFATKHLNYNGCVIAHYNTPGFHGTTWHVYLNQKDALWRAKNEVIKLLDQNSHTVAAFRY